MQDIELHHWPVGKLIPYGRNPRKNDHVIEQMAGAIADTGPVQVTVLAATGADAEVIATAAILDRDPARVFARHGVTGIALDPISTPVSTAISTEEN